MLAVIPSISPQRFKQIQRLVGDLCSLEINPVVIANGRSLDLALAVTLFDGHVTRENVQYGKHASGVHS